MCSVSRVFGFAVSFGVLHASVQVIVDSTGLFMACINGLWKSVSRLHGKIGKSDSGTSVWRFACTDGPALKSPGRSPGWRFTARLQVLVLLNIFAFLSACRLNRLCARFLGFPGLLVSFHLLYVSVQVIVDCTSLIMACINGLCPNVAWQIGNRKSENPEFQEKNQEIQDFSGFSGNY